MHYLSTRGESGSLSFADVLLAGLARDGGLYVPATWPTLSAGEIAGFAGRPWAGVAHAVVSPFVGGAITDDALKGMIVDAADTFRHQAVTPLVQLADNLFLLELFHGPTLAFKDVAMQLLGRMMDHLLRLSGRRACIVGATSGDTGAAAIEAFRGLPNVDVFILYPHDRVSDVQRRQMTTLPDANVHTLALEGTFDDCQAILKALFNRHHFRDEMGLSGVNSINWARVVAQVTYFFTSAVALGSPHRKVSFAVPTGNFGDVLAGWVAGRMGLPIERLVVATNANDILVRALESGDYAPRAVVPTQSPSMDIQVSSNFERLLFEAGGRDPAAIRAMMGSLAQSGRFTLAPPMLETVRKAFDAVRVDEAGMRAEMARTHAATGVVLDPHSAIAVSAARDTLARDPATPVIALATAHPAKFPDAVEQATGQRPALTPHLAELMGRPERIHRVPNDVDAVASFVRAHARVGAPA